MNIKIHTKENESREVKYPHASYIGLLLCASLTLIGTFFIYKNIQWLFNNSLQNRALGIVTVASLNFEPSELDKIEGIQSVDTNAYTNIVLKLQKIRELNPDIKYAYIQRKTNDFNTLEFVADADALDPYNPIDHNKNGKIDPSEELSLPGDSYDISEYPDFIEIAFNKPYVDGNPYVDQDDELSSDQWGTLFSATAPIPDANGFARYLVGIDLDVTSFLRLTNVAIIPFVLFVVFLLLILTGLTVFLVRIWKSRVEILKETDRQKDELLGIVSHQLATPVSSIKWYTEMLIDGDLGKVTKEQKEHLNSMSLIAAGLSDLVSMILDVSRIQLGRIKIERQELDLKVFFNEILEIILPKAKEKKQNFEVSVPKSFPKATLDKRYTLMTIENLLSNAIKYTPEGGKVIFKVEVKGGMIFCEVTDTGCGIPKSDQDKIFGKLFRASNVRNNIDGNGFGLYVAKGAVESQGGKISFKSEEGKGTSFFVQLPLKGK